MARTKVAQVPMFGVVTQTTPQAYTWRLTKEVDVYATAHVLRQVADTLIDKHITRIEFDSDDEGTLVITAQRPTT